MLLSNRNSQVIKGWICLDDHCSLAVSIVVCPSGFRGGDLSSLRKRPMMEIRLAKGNRLEAEDRIRKPHRTAAAEVNSHSKSVAQRIREKEVGRAGVS